MQTADLAVCFLFAIRDADNTSNLSDLDPDDLRRAFWNFRDTLIEYGAIDHYPATGAPKGYIIGMAGVPVANQVICSLNPFCFVSHLSAMAWHGLTDRLPKTIFLSQPSGNFCRELAYQKLESQLGPLMQIYRKAKFPLNRPIELSSVKKQPLHFWKSRRLDKAYSAAFKNVQGGELRVATVSRCFLDMVREPQLCGGIHHVIEIFEEHSFVHFNAIVSELDQHGNKIEQARTGYLIEMADAALVDHPVLKRWANDVTRGGSRKLDPSADYADTYSERWALSINA